MTHSFKRPLAALILAGAFSLITSVGYAQKHNIDRTNLHAVSANEPVKGGERLVPGPFPGWPPALQGTQYYRLSAFKGYYEVPTRKYFYFSPASNNWIGSSQPPMAFRGKNPSTFGATPITYHGTSPWDEKPGPTTAPSHPAPATQPVKSDVKPDNTGRPAPNTLPKKEGGKE